MKRLRESNNGENLPTCDFCGYPAVKLKQYRRPFPSDKKDVFCEICAYSPAGKTKCAMFAANAILDQMGAFDGLPTWKDGAEPEE